MNAGQSRFPLVINQLLEGNNHGNCEKSCGEEGTRKEGRCEEGCTGKEGRCKEGPGEEGCTGQEGCCKEGRSGEEGCCKEGSRQEAHPERRVHEGPDPQPATRGRGRFGSAAPYRSGQQAVGLHQE